jgi:PAS domain S-box-containing protein
MESWNLHLDDICLPAALLSPQGILLAHNKEAFSLFCPIPASPNDHKEGFNLLIEVASERLKQVRGLTNWEHRFQRSLQVAGSEHHLEFRLKEVENRSGNKAWLIIIVDRTDDARWRSNCDQLKSELEGMVQARTQNLQRLNESLRGYLSDQGKYLEKLEFFLHAVQETNDHILITDHLGLIQFVNPAFEQVTGYSLSELIGKTPRVLKSGLLPDSFFKGLWKRLVEGKVFRAEFINKKKNGEIYWEEKTITPIHGLGGKVTHYISVGRDVTERAKSENERVKRLSGLEKTLANSQHLEGILPICSGCKKIRDSHGNWTVIEIFLHSHSGLEFSHGLCPECSLRFFPKVSSSQKAESTGQQS